MKQESKDNALLATGLLTEFAFLQSLIKSKTLFVMCLIRIAIFGGLGLFLYKMAGA